MKIKHKPGIWIIAVMAVSITVMNIFLLRQASDLSYYLSVRNLERLIDHQAEFWKSREDAYIRTLHTLANVMGNYESIQAAQRRDMYDEVLRSTLETESQMIALYTVWKPDAIDNMDSRYIGRTGSSPTGQYAMTYSRETGKITERTSYDIRNVMSHIIGPSSRKDCVNNPSILKVNGMDTFIIRMVVPIINNRTDEVVGGLGCYFVINTIQHIMENTMKANDEIAMMMMYSSNGTILAHSVPDRIGKMMLDVDEEFGDSRQAMYQAIQKGNLYRDTKYSPVFNENIIFVMKPFQIGNSNQNWSILIGVPESYVLKEVRPIIILAVILTLTTALLTAAIFLAIYIIHKKQQTTHDGRQDDTNNSQTQSYGSANDDSKEMFNVSLEVINENRNPDQITNENAAEINDLAAVTEQINKTTTKINEIYLRNKEKIGFLTKESHCLRLNSQTADVNKKYA